MTTRVSISEIVIIKSLGINEYDTAEAIRRFLEQKDIPSRVVDCSSQHDFSRVIESLCNLVSSRDRYSPLIHIECHGNESGLVFKDDSSLSWENIYLLLVKLNLVTKFNLFLVLSCCYGGLF